MFRLVTANDAAKLADALGKRLRAPSGNPLEPARVLVPQAGLKRWLQVHLAEQLGVVANVEFTPPAQFTWELLRAARPDLPRHSPFDVEVLRWHVYALLGEPLDGAALAPLHDYLATDGDPLRRYALSFELARAYERMQGYRRERLLAWERGADKHDWQAELWRRLLPRIGGASRAARVDEWLRAFDPEHPDHVATVVAAPPGLPDRLACFACANVSPDVLRMLAVASRHCDIDFYLPLPSMEYLGDLPRTRAAVRARLGEGNSENPLVTSFGGALAAFVELLFGYQHVQPDVEHDDYDEDIPRTTLLGRVRDDILKHRLPPHDDARDALPDDSLQFHACHTPLREVQTLHDALLAMLETDKTLQPRDIAVMLPDVAAYQPAIEAVFGGIDRGDKRWLPFNLGDAGAVALHPVAQLFLDLLDAPTSRWEADELLDVLAAPGVMRRFDLEDDARERLARDVRAAGVRWGEDEHARADCGGYREFSWAFGTDRLLAGFACGDDNDALAGDTAPLPGIEGAGFAHLDAVFAVTETWRHLRELSRSARTATDWQRELNDVLDTLYQPDPHDLGETRALERVRGALARLADDSARADATLTLPWADVRAFLRDALAAPDPQQFLFTGGITFCGLVPLRVVPFRVICLLGMDETAFPRRETSGLDPLAADRRAGKRESGDRDVRADDRLLFLQLLGAARDAFYVSWIGRDAHTNEPRPPSVVVAELRDLVRDRYLLAPADEDACKARDALLPRVAPLHAFAASLFGADDNTPRSFHNEWLPAARTPQRTASGIDRFVTQPLPRPAVAPTDISLDELKRFFDDPARGFLEHALQLRLPRNAEEDADVEPLQPDDPRLRWRLANALLQHDTDDAPLRRKLLRAQGELPPGTLADAALAIAQTRADAVREAIDVFTDGQSRLDDATGVITLDDGTWITGTVVDVYPAGLVRWSPGGFSGKRVLRAWLDNLFLAILRNSAVTCRFLWIDKDKAQQRDIITVGADEARLKLAQIVAAYRDGLRAPLPLFPDATARAFKLWRQAGPLDRDDDRDAFMTALASIADKVDDDGAFADAADFDKPSVRLAWRGVILGNEDAALAARMHQNACDLFPRLRAVPKAKQP